MYASPSKTKQEQAARGKRNTDDHLAAHRHALSMKFKMDKVASANLGDAFKLLTERRISPDMHPAEMEELIKEFGEFTRGFFGMLSTTFNGLPLPVAFEMLADEYTWNVHFVELCRNFEPVPSVPLADDEDGVSFNMDFREETDFEEAVRLSKEQVELDEINHAMVIFAEAKSAELAAAAPHENTYDLITGAINAFQSQKSCVGATTFRAARNAVLEHVEDVSQNAMLMYLIEIHEEVTQATKFHSQFFAVWIKKYRDYLTQNWQNPETETTPRVECTCGNFVYLCAHKDMWRHCSACGEETDLSKWSCDTCTFKNKHDAKCCEMCRKPK